MPDQRLGRLFDLPRTQLMGSPTPLEFMPNLTQACNGAQLWVKRDDATGLAFGGNKVRQLEFYFGEASAQGADTVLITGAVQSNFVRLAAAGACKLGMQCHVQLEERVSKADARYRNSGNVLINKMLGASISYYSEGEDEEGADQQIREIAANLEKAGRKPYVIPLAPGHKPLGALGYVVAAAELLDQFQEKNLTVDEIVVASGSGNTHAGLLAGLKALDSDIIVSGVCVRRNEALQRPRIAKRCAEIAELLGVPSKVRSSEVNLMDNILAPGYGCANDATMKAILLGAGKEALMLDPTYTGKAFAEFLEQARNAPSQSVKVFLHTGGTPGIFAYESSFEQYFDQNAAQTG